jgi:hypothetical protein
LLQFLVSQGSLYWPGWFPMHFHFVLCCLVSVWFAWFFEKLRGRFLWLECMIFIMESSNYFEFYGNCINMLLFLCCLPYLFRFQLLYVFFLGMFWLSMFVDLEVSQVHMMWVWHVCQIQNLWTWRTFKSKVRTLSRTAKTQVTWVWHAYHTQETYVACQTQVTWIWHACQTQPTWV